MGGLVDDWLPTLEINSAQTGGEVLELLLLQLAYPPALGTEVETAWLDVTTCNHM